ncbi:MAG: hypothetical protein JWR58_2249, partial [Pseudonocardia sp.]|nr:hypothetical protein [Pseudonocardia sp.]
MRPPRPFRISFGCLSGAFIGMLESGDQMIGSSSAVNVLERLAAPELRGNPFPLLHWLRENEP